MSTFKSQTIDINENVLPLLEEDIHEDQKINKAQTRYMEKDDLVIEGLLCLWRYNRDGQLEKIKETNFNHAQKFMDGGYDHVW